MSPTGRWVRSNTQATQGATINAMTRDARDPTSIIVSDRENAKIFLSGLENIEELDDVDRTIFSRRVSHFLIFWLDVYLQSQRSLLATPVLAGRCRTS